MSQAVPLLRADHLTRTVADKTIVDSISLDVHQGDVLALVGPSGAGKSTLLRLLNRLDEPSGGTVFLDGQDYRQIPPPELRRRVGMVLQQPFLFPGTVADNLRFGPKQRGETLPQDKLDFLLDSVDLPGYGARNVVNLSGGEAQRVSVARTLANDPQVVLLDEPTSALDDEAKQQVEALLRRIIADQHLTCVIVTHDMPQAGRLANRVMVLERGHVARAGSVEEVLHVKPVV